MTVLPMNSPYGDLACRGSLGRITELQEQFQTGLIHSITHSAGCRVVNASIDDGIDMMIKHFIIDENDVRFLNLQLKTTTTGWNADRTLISTSLSKKRYDMMRSEHKHIPSIVVVMDLDPKIENWYSVKESIRGNCYWVDITGAEDKPDNKSVSVSASIGNVCARMVI